MLTTFSPGVGWACAGTESPSRSCGPPGTCRMAVAQPATMNAVRKMARRLRASVLTREIVARLRAQRDARVTYELGARSLASARLFERRALRRLRCKRTGLQKL